MYIGGYNIYTIYTPKREKRVFKIIIYIRETVKNEEEEEQKN